MLAWRHLGAALVVATLVPHPAGATGLYPAGPVVVIRIPAYYYAPPCYTLPLVHSPTYVYPLTVAPAVPLAVPLAVPTPAPPSKPTVEPPVSPKLEMPPAVKAMNVPMAPAGGTAAPTVLEARSTNPPGGPAKDRCRVGFWNLSGKDVSLVVDGKSHAVARDRAVTLELPRTFVWRINQQAPNTERVADDQATFEVVIR
jgi:hypothetical protein